MNEIIKFVIARNKRIKIRVAIARLLVNHFRLLAYQVARAWAQKTGQTFIALETYEDLRTRGILKAVE